MTIKFSIQTWNLSTRLRGWAIWPLGIEETIVLGLAAAFYAWLAVGMIGGYWSAMGGR